MIAFLALAFATPPVLLDFGLDEGAVFAGFAQASPRVMGDPRATWREVPARYSDAGWPDPLLADGISDGVVHLAIPAGTWTVAALIDDVAFSLKPVPGARSGLELDGAAVLVESLPADASFFSSRRHAANPRPRFGPGLGPWDRQVAPAYRWRVTSVVVGPNGLLVRPIGGPLAALVVSRDDTATVEVEVALIDARRRAWYEVNRPAWPEADLPRAVDGPLGLEPLDAGRRPTGPRPLPAPIPLAPGEQHLLYVAVHGGEGPADVALTGLDGLDPELYEVDWLDVQEGRFPRPEPFTLRPAEGGLRGEQGLTPILAVRLRARPDLSPGTRSGTLTVRRGDGSAASLDLSVSIRALSLHAPVAPLGVWADLRATVAAIHGPDSPEAQNVWARDVALMRSFEVERLNLRGVFYPGGWPGVGYEPPIDRLRRVVGVWREAGGGPVVWVDPAFFFGRSLQRDPYAPAMSEPVAATATGIVEAAREVGVGVYVADEIAALQGASVLEPAQRFLDALNAAAGEPRVPLAIADPHAGVWPILADRVDIVYQQHAPHLDPEAARLFDGHRARAQTYTALYRREATGRLAWLYGTDAVTVWHYNEPTNDPFNDLRPSPQWQLAVLDADGSTPLPTTRLASLAQGVQDQRYLVTTSALVREFAGARRPAVAAAVDRACDVLNVAASGVIGRLPQDHPRRGLSDDLALEDLRVALGDAAEALARWSRRQRDARRGRQLAPIDGGWPERCGPGPTLPEPWRYGQ